jgi:hypothetical protein
MGTSKKTKSEASRKEQARTVRSELPFDPADETHPRGLRRFGRRLAEFQKKLEESRNAPPVEAAGDYQRHPHLAKAMPGHRLHKAGGRTPLFLLQALARLERGTRKDRAVLDGLLGEIKRLEDTIGDIDYWWAFLENGEKKGLPSEVLAWAANKHAQACGRLEGWLAAGDWVDHKYLGDETDVALRTRQLGEQLLELDWPKAKKERKRFAAYLAERLRRVHADALALDMDDLEGGLHELRRKLRWFSIYPRALDGLIVLDEKASAPAGWGRYMVESIVTSPFSKLPAAGPGEDPLVMPAPLFYALSWIIDDLGRVKDAAQETELVENGLHAAKINAEPSKWLGQSAIGHQAAGAHAREVLAQTIEKDQLLLRLADVFAAQV